MAMACFKERIDRGSKNSKETWIEGKRGRGKPKKKGEWKWREFER